MKYSVVIPAYNEAEYIEAAIRALILQNVKRSEFEIIVVDNNSTDNTSELALNAGADIVIKKMTRGTNFARQEGFKKSKGEIVAFLDADSEPPPDWLERIGKILSGSEVAAVSGPYDYNFKGIKKMLDYFYTRYILPNVPLVLNFIFRKKAGIIIGGNLAAKRSTIEAIGGLPLLTFWSDDAAIAMLISRKVGKVIFNPDLVIKSSPRRFEKGGLLKLVLLYIIAYLRAYFSRNYR